MSSTSRRRSRLVLALVVSVGALAACSSSGSGASGSSDPTTSATGTVPIFSNGSSPSSTGSTVPTSSPTPTVSRAATTTVPKKPVSSQGWVVDAFHATRGANGNWSATATVRNTDAKPRSGNFVFTLTRNARGIASLTGSAATVPGGGRVQVSLVSTQRFSAGAFAFFFAATFGF